MTVHHGGQIEVVDENSTYDGEKVDLCDFCSIKFLDLISLDVFARRLGYREEVSFYYKIMDDGNRCEFALMSTDYDVFFCL